MKDLQYDACMLDKYEVIPSLALLASVLRKCKSPLYTGSEVVGDGGCMLIGVGSGTPACEFWWAGGDIGTESETKDSMTQIHGM